MSNWDYYNKNYGSGWKMPNNLYDEYNLPFLQNSYEWQQPVNMGDLYGQTVQSGISKSQTPTTSSNNEPPSWLLPAAGGATAIGGLYNMFNSPSAPNFNYSVPQTIPGDMVRNWRRYNKMINEGTLAQNMDETRRNVARMGLNNSGYLSSLQQPAYKTYAQGSLAGEKAISDAELQAWLRLQEMEMQKAMAQMQAEMWEEENKYGFGDFLGDAASVLTLGLL